MTLPHPSERLCASMTEAARLLGVSVWTIGHYVRGGRLRSLRLGERRMIAYGTLAQHLACSVTDVQAAIANGWEQ